MSASSGSAVENFILARTEQAARKSIMLAHKLKAEKATFFGAMKKQSKEVPEGGDIMKNQPLLS